MRYRGSTVGSPGKHQEINIGIIVRLEAPWKHHEIPIHHGTTIEAPWYHHGITTETSHGNPTHHMVLPW